MADLEYLRQLLPILRANGVNIFKEEGLEVKLSADVTTEIEPKASQSHTIIDAIKKQEAQLPPDLRADDLFNNDKVLHWSGSGDDGPMPLTGEETLAAP